MNNMGRAMGHGHTDALQSSEFAGVLPGLNCFRLEYSFAKGSIFVVWVPLGFP